MNDGVDLLRDVGDARDPVRGVEAQRFVELAPNVEM